VNATNLVIWIRQEFPAIYGKLFQDLQTNLGVSHYRRFSNEELHSRCLVIYERLCNWLENQDRSAVRKPAFELGKERFEDDIPLGQLVLGILLLEKHLWLHVEETRKVTVLDVDIRERVIEFFQKTIFWAARGYEEALEKASVGRMNAPAQPLIRPIPEHKREAEEVIEGMEMSRGGQVGEQGG
jgi:hypothetical protein